MSESANTLATRKVTRAHRITVCAQKLTDQYGFDGFTMDELAEAAGVSRRTLFNYFPGKLDAVLAMNLSLDQDVIDTFVAGGPGGQLIDDLHELVKHVISIKEFSAQEAQVARRIIKSDSRLLSAVHERFESVTQDFTDRILTREGASFGARRAKVLVTILACLYDVALSEVLDDPSGNRELHQAYAVALDDVRALFG
ncbi:MAG: TetR/AcrR family transcriptional regulator [Nocardioides sp.]|nr:TetR/AcrR family transcriptional regulator [Nocardioides sp.]